MLVVARSSYNLASCFRECSILRRTGLGMARTYVPAREAPPHRCEQCVEGAIGKQPVKEGQQLRVRTHKVSRMRTSGGQRMLDDLGYTHCRALEHLADYIELLAVVTDPVRRKRAKTFLNGTKSLFEHWGLDIPGFDNRNVDSPRLELGAKRIKERDIDVNPVNVNPVNRNYDTVMIRMADHALLTEACDPYHADRRCGYDKPKQNQALKMVEAGGIENPGQGEPGKKT
jgi:hypothetical protein